MLSNVTSSNQFLSHCLLCMVVYTTTSKCPVLCAVIEIIALDLLLNPTPFCFDTGKPSKLSVYCLGFLAFPISSFSHYLILRSCFAQVKLVQYSLDIRILPKPVFQYSYFNTPETRSQGIFVKSTVSSLLFLFTCSNDKRNGIT